jgi:nitric oxide reductase subunit B
MVFATLLPLGVIQLWHSVNDGYFEARSLSFITTPGNAVLEWLRMPGDVIFIGGGVLPFLWITWLGVRYRITSTTSEVPVEALFVEEELVAVTRAAEQREAAAGSRGRDARNSRYASNRGANDTSSSGADPRSGGRTP